METSKKILLYCDALTLLSVAAAFVVALVGVDMAGLSEIVVALVGLSAAAHSFYYWKAKSENMKKFEQMDGEDGNDPPGEVF